MKKILINEAGFVSGVKVGIEAGLETFKDLSKIHEFCRWYTNIFIYKELDGLCTAHSMVYYAYGNLMGDIHEIDEGYNFNGELYNLVDTKMHSAETMEKIYKLITENELRVNLKHYDFCEVTFGGDEMITIKKILEKDETKRISYYGFEKLHHSGDIVHIEVALRHGHEIEDFLRLYQLKNEEIDDYENLFGRAKFVLLYPHPIYDGRNLVGIEFDVFTYGDCI